MRFTIDELAADTDPEHLRRAYYLPRKPLVLRAAASRWPALERWDAVPIARRLQESPELATRQPLWWDVDREWAGRDVHDLAWLEYLRRLHRPRQRGRPLRIWTSVQGSATPWHYDGNCLEVFNVQVAGHKRFTLVSPATPLPCLPFSLLVREGGQLDACDYTQFELHPGDLLYLPRHWLHFVESLGEANINVNWVWTDLASGPWHVAGSRRERELLALVYPLFAGSHWLTQAGFKLGSPRLQQFHEQYVREYGGEGDFAVSRRFFQEVGARRMLGRVLSELAPWAA